MYNLLKFIVIGIILVTLCLSIFYWLQVRELNTISLKKDINTLYNEIDYGDILCVRLTTTPGRIAMLPFDTFFHFLIVVKLPGDDNKYVFHTKNTGIKPLLHPELGNNTKTFGKQDNYQFVELKEYLSYLGNKKEYLIHLKNHNHYNYTMTTEEVKELKTWRSFFGKNCCYLLMKLMKKKGWTVQEDIYYTNRTYYTPSWVSHRLERDDNYTHEGIIKIT
jgi:hypothetical protein